jgi:hypothetical protein
MPYRIVQEKGGWFVVDDTGKHRNLKPYPSRAAAMPFFRKLWSVESSKHPGGPKK